MSDTGPMLHILDGHATPWAHLHALASIVDRTDDRVLMIGNTEDARRAIGAGLDRFDRIQALRNSPRNATRQITRYIASRGPFRSVRDWSTNPPNAVRGAFPATSDDRAGVRAEWQIGHDTLVIGSAHDHPREVDAMRLVYHAAILSVAEVPTVAVIPSEAEQLERAARWAWRHGRARWIVVDDRSPLLLRDTVDVSCWQVSEPATGVSTLEMLASSGQQVVAERCDLTEPLTGKNIRLCEPNSELGATRALFKDPVRLHASPDPDGLISSLGCSLAGV